MLMMGIAEQLVWLAFHAPRTGFSRRHGFFEAPSALFKHVA
jgi:hypothetical protein